MQEIKSMNIQEIYAQYLDFEKRMYEKYPKEKASKILQVAWIEYKIKKSLERLE